MAVYEFECAKCGATAACRRCQSPHARASTLRHRIVPRSFPGSLLFEAVDIRDALRQAQARGINDVTAVTRQD